GPPPCPRHLAARTGTLGAHHPVPDPGGRVGHRPVRRLRDPSQDGDLSGAPGGRGLRRALAACSIALALTVPFVHVRAATFDPADASVRGPAAAAAPNAWIVTLRPGAVAPEGVGVSARRYRLDT